MTTFTWTVLAINALVIICAIWRENHNYESGFREWLWRNCYYCGYDKWQSYTKPYQYPMPELIWKCDYHLWYYSKHTYS